jgi:hypothetical protein
MMESQKAVSRRFAPSDSKVLKRIQPAVERVFVRPSKMDRVERNLESGALALEFHWYATLPAAVERVFKRLYMLNTPHRNRKE